MKHTEETKQKMSKKHSGKLNPFWGKKHTKKSRKKMSESRKGLHVGEKHPNWKGGKSKKAEGYIILHLPSHPFSTPKGYVLEHRFVMENHLGRYLKPEELVHHKNGKRDDNRIENLELFESNKKHLDYHKKLLREKRK